MCKKCLEPTWNKLIGYFLVLCIANFVNKLALVAIASSYSSMQSNYLLDQLFISLNWLFNPVSSTGLMVGSLGNEIFYLFNFLDFIWKYVLICLVFCLFAKIKGMEK